MKTRIYLDNNATTLVDPRVSAAMIHFLNQNVGNPSSVHSFGRSARALLQKNRLAIAEYFQVKPHEIIFTSGGTEGLNMTIRGLLTGEKGHIISSDVEHPSVYSTLKGLQDLGWEVTFLPAGLWGSVKTEDVLNSLRSNTKLICLMAVNNETGVKTDIEAIASIAKDAKIPFICDAVALLGKENFRIPLGVSAMCFSGHKIHAPAGIGFVFIRSGLKLLPLFTGGQQEFQRRAGTENLLGITGLAESIKLLSVELEGAVEQMRNLRDRLEQKILHTIPGTSVNGAGLRVANTTNIAFHGLDGESLLAAMDMEGVAVSHGSACSSGALEPSRILLNMGLSRDVARSSLRFSLSRFTTEEEIDRTLEIIAGVISRMPS